MTNKTQLLCYRVEWCNFEILKLNMFLDKTNSA